MSTGVTLYTKSGYSYRTRFYFKTLPITADYLEQLKIKKSGKCTKHQACSVDKYSLYVLAVCQISGPSPPWGSQAAAPRQRQGRQPQPGLP